ncbi:retinal-binding protein-like [Ostrea edulis]|uniref:retinal-binding protein-like n=1 Tax=Ostrea edulis TaxID=37623 RepID=UPI0024AF06DA|nr:retinal-binding protein-like [Ostrea edulis]XP_048763252.2 retinal-binding protein-like [Ostrea edulis]
MSKKKYSLNGQLEPITTQRDPDIDQIPAPQQPRSKEEIALAKFKLKIQDLIKPDHDDVYLRRWLKARSYDVDKAEQMYRASMAFREKMHVDTILQKYQQPEVLQKYLTGGFCGHAKDGSPVRIEPYGRLDMKGIMCSVKKSDLEKAKIQQCERTLRDWKAESKKRGYRVDGLTVVFDMAGVSTKMLWRPGLKMYLHLVKVLEDNYPEMMRYLLIINAPGIFPLLYKMCRPLISEDMKKKIHVIGGDYKEYLLKYIDATNLPVCYGGALTDPDGDPTCRTMICYGGEVPKHYYLQTADFQEQMQSAVIPRGEKLNIDVQVDRKGSILKWEFRTEDYDIGFGVFYQSSSGSVPVVQTSRANSHVVSEDGSYICDELGTYTLCFDNSFSWTRNKRIYYSAEVMYADDSLITTEINSLIEQGDWETLSQRYETTHL